MRAATIVLTLAAAATLAGTGAGCDDSGSDGTSPAGDAGPIDAPFSGFEIDVVRTVEPGDAGTRVTVYLHDIAAFQDCLPFANFPKPGECGYSTDVFSCTHEPWRCLTEARVEQSGAVLATQISGYALPINFAFLDLDPALPATVVLVGCGGTHTFPLLPAGDGAPVITQIIAGTNDTRIDIEAPDWAETLFYSFSFGFGGPRCHTEKMPSHTLDRRLRPGPVWMSVNAFAPVLAGTSPIGTWRSWTGRVAEVEAWVTDSDPLSNGNVLSFGLPDDRPGKVRLSLGGITTELDVTVYGTFAGPTLDTDLQLSAWPTEGSGAYYFEVFSLAAGDVLRVRIPVTDINEVAFPHVAPTSPLDFNLTGDGVYSVAYGPMTLASIDTPGATLTIDAFELTWDVGPLIVMPD